MESQELIEKQKQNDEMSRPQLLRPQAIDPSSRDMKLQMSRSRQRPSLFPPQFFLILLLTAFCNELCRLLPISLLLISFILHAFGIVLVLAIALIQDIQIRSRRKASLWHLLFFVLLYKYVAAMDCSQGNLGSRILLQLAISTFYYVVYFCNSDSQLALPSKQYVIVIFACFLGIVSTQVHNQYGQETIIHGLYLGLSHLFRHFKFDMEVGQRPWNLKYMPLLTPSPIHKPSQLRFQSTAFLTLTLCFISLSANKQCRDHWHWLTIWIASVSMGNGSSHSVSYLKHRYFNVIAGWAIVMVGQWTFGVEFDHNSPVSAFNFHWSNLIFIFIAYLYAVLESHAQFPNADLSAFSFITLPNLPRPSTTIDRHKDLPYKKSLETLAAILLSLLTLQTLLTYIAYSRIYYESSSRIRNNGNEEKQNSVFSFRQGGGLADQAHFGYFLIVLFCIAGNNLIQMMKTDNLNNMKKKLTFFLLFMAWLLWASESPPSDYQRIYFSLRACQHSDTYSFVLIQLLLTTFHLFSNSFIRKRRLLMLLGNSFVFWVCCSCLYINLFYFLYDWECSTVEYWASWALSTLILTLQYEKGSKKLEKYQ